MKKILLSLMAVVCALTVSAKEYILTPSAATTIDPASADANQYDASATLWKVSQGAISGTSLKSYDLKYLIFQMDLKDLDGMTIQKAVMSYDSKCTVSSKNSNVELASINPAWDVTTVTWNSLNADAKAVQISADKGQNVGTTTKNLKENVLNYVKNEAGKTVAFAIYTYTAREQQISNIKLTIDAIDASASVNVNVKYMCGETEVKSATTIGTKDQAVELSTEEKADFILDGKKYIYVSDNGASVLAAEGSDVIVNVREAAVYLWHVMSTQGGEVAKGANFEGDNIEVGYPRYQRNELTNELYEAPKTNDSRKRYTVNVLLDKDNASVDMTYNKVKDNVVYYQEAEDIDGLTKVTYGNVFVRASNALAAKATENTVITNLPAGKYVVNAGVFSSAKSPAYVIKIGVGDNVYEAPVTKVNNSEVKSAEYTLTKTTAVTLFADGMGDNNALDYIYIEKTGEYVVPDNTVAAGKYIAQVTIAEAEGVAVPAEFQAYVGTHKYGMDLAGDEKKLTISGMSIMNNMEIVGDAVAYDATKTFTMNGKEFTICSVDGTKTEGELAVTKNEDGSISIEDFGFMKGGKFAGTAKNITAQLQVNEETEANITFEDIDLQGKTYYKGEDKAMSIPTGDFTFINYFADYGSYTAWNGFAVSATRGDNFVGNYSDDSQFNSCTAGGMQSEKFAIGYYSEYDARMEDQYPEIYATKNIKPEYVYINNTASAYISMTQGDGYAEKFQEGDFLKLTISGMVYDEEEEDYVVQSSVDFYLGKDENIVSEWTKVDLTSLGVCESIRFTMSCSQTSDSYMKTPAYFALDNMKAAITDEPTTAVKGVANVQKAAQKVQKLMKNGQILIKTANGIVNAAGAQVK